MTDDLMEVTWSLTKNRNRGMEIGDQAPLKTPVALPVESSPSQDSPLWDRTVCREAHAAFLFVYSGSLMSCVVASCR